jgi:uncharacterized protein YceK
LLGRLVAKRSQMTIRRFVVLLLPVVAVVSGCTTAVGNEKTSVGYISGYAQLCQGPYASEQAQAATPVRVQLIESAKVVKAETVTGRHNYRFAVPPGTYSVKSDQGGTTPKTITVTAGQRRSVDLLSICR